MPSAPISFSAKFTLTFPALPPTLEASRQGRPTAGTETDFCIRTLRT